MSVPLPSVATNYRRSRVICDVNVLVLAGLALLKRGGELDALAAPTGSFELDILVELYSRKEVDPNWQLCASPRLIQLTQEVLQIEYHLPEDVAQAYGARVRDLVDETGGDYTRPTVRVTGLSGDSEDDRNVLSLASTLDARLVVTNDRGLLGGDRTGWAPWHVPNVPVAVEAIPARVFAALLAADRRGEI